jgi:predicted phosphodiesterase
MKINVISDLHLDFEDLTLPGGDVLIISGDACEARHLKKSLYQPNGVTMLPHEKGRSRPDRYYRFFEEECKKYRETIYVMGNHEHYGFQYHKTYEHLQLNLPDHVTLLENQTHDIDDVTFVGATLWTDMNNMDPLTMYHMTSMMNDYRSITMFNEVKNVYHRLQPERTVEDFHKSRDYIRHVIENNPQRKYVIVTHHAPTKLSTHPRYQNETIMNGAYSSNLIDFILEHPQIRLWTHGHTHDPFDYMIGTTRVVCNPRGYAGYESRADQFDAKQVEITL